MLLLKPNISLALANSLYNHFVSSASTASSAVCEPVLIFDAKVSSSELLLSRFALHLNLLLGHFLLVLPRFRCWELMRLFFRVISLFACRHVCFCLTAIGNRVCPTCCVRFASQWSITDSKKLDWFRIGLSLRWVSTSQVQALVGSATS